MDATETTAASTNGRLIVEECDPVDNLKVVEETDRHLNGSPTPSEQSYVDFDPVNNEYVDDLDSYTIEQNCAYMSNTDINDQPPDYLEVITTQQNSAYSIEASNVYCVADSVVAGHENGELYEAIPEEGELYEVLPEGGERYDYVLPVLPERREPTGVVSQRGEQNNAVQEREEDAKKKVTPPAQGLCSFWQGRVEVTIRIIILMVSPVLLLYRGNQHAVAVIEVAS